MIVNPTIGGMKPGPPAARREIKHAIVAGIHMVDKVDRGCGDRCLKRFPQAQSMADVELESQPAGEEIVGGQSGGETEFLKVGDLMCHAAEEPQLNGAGSRRGMCRGGQQRQK
jgi:hypothetical protein